MEDFLAAIAGADEVAAPSRDELSRAEVSMDEVRVMVSSLRVLRLSVSTGHALPG
jgi:hypothetical protein